jgi:DNA repair exonuclease SbcCD ATPase subunit
VFKGEGEYQAETTETTQERMIVRTGDMSLVVKDITQACDEIAQLAARFDGYVVSSQISGEEEEMRGWISIRVPDDKFDQALAELRNLAVRVKSESTSSQDVTEEYIDLQSRLNNAEATEKQYLALLEKATDVEDILRIYESLSQVRQEIEQIKGQMQYLERTASMSRISVYLEPQATAKPLVHAGWSALEALKSAVRGIVIFGQWLVILAIWLIIFIPVWGTAVGIIYWRRKRKA